MSNAPQIISFSKTPENIQNLSSHSKPISLIANLIEPTYKHLSVLRINKHQTLTLIGFSNK